MCVSKALIQSPAWWELKDAAPKVCMIFLAKRNLEEAKVSGKPGKRQKEWVVSRTLTPIVSFVIRL